VVIATARVPGWLTVAISIGLLGVAAVWVIQFMRGQWHPAWDIAEAGVLLATAATTRPMYVLLLMYVRVCVLALEGNRSRAIWASGVYAAAFLGSAVADGELLSSAIGLQFLFLAAGFPLAAAVMRTIGSVLARDLELDQELRRRALESRLSEIVEHSSDIFVVFDESLRVEYASPSVQRVVGARHYPQALEDLVHPADVGSVQGSLRQVLEGEITEVRTSFLMAPSGGDGPEVEALVTSVGGERPTALLTARDITEQRHAEESVRLSESNFRALFTLSPQPMWVYDSETLHFMEVNEAAVQHYGYTREEFLSMLVTDIRPREDLPKHGTEMEGPTPEIQRSGEWRHVLKDGRRIVVDIAAHRLEFSGRPAIVVLANDVTERRQLDHKLLHQALHDSLTGLANRALFQDRVGQAVARRSRANTLFAVVFIDLDNFKVINDTVGHTSGDAVLVEVAHRLQHSVRPADTAARLGGDEFAVLVEDLPRRQKVREVAERIAGSLDLPIEVEDDSWFVSASIGIAFSGDGGETVDAIMRNADVAMYDAKKRGRGKFAVFEPAMYESVVARQTLEGELRQAMDRDELVVHYQPQVDLKHNTITGVEALVRWEHTRLGLLPPGEFVPLAEEAGLVTELDSWVLSHSAAQVRAWDLAGIPLVTLGVNISALDLGTADLPDRILAVITESGLAASQVELEVTESVAFENENARSNIAKLRALGFRVAIDDFGVGFSMLGRLQDLPVDRLKIDRSFIERITFGEDEAPIVTGIIAMAHSLRLKVIAEGVETTEQLTFLRRNGCDQVQGFRLGRPMPAQEIEPILRSRTSNLA
jgi:diguanylate cyclase (GGDEF)-like protein/PAS domain S-box-containing protein